MNIKDIAQVVRGILSIKDEVEANANQTSTEGNTTEDKKDEAPTNVQMNAEAKEDPRLAALEQAVKDIATSVAELNKDKAAEVVMSAVNELKKEIEAQKVEIAKFSAQADGEIAGAEKKKIEKPEIEHAALKKLLA